jgi:ribonuclease R
MTNYPNRVDLTHLPFYTIDPIGAKDFDDAIYYDKVKHKLFIAIADVSSYISEETPLDKEALKRSFSIYFPDIVFPMLPSKFSDDICSLKPNLNRLSFVYEIDLDKKNKIKDFKLYEAIIQSKRRFSYDEVDEILQNNLDNKSDVIVESIQELYRITLYLRKNRIFNGFEFKSIEYKQKLIDDRLIGVDICHSTPSHSLIEECMLIANKISASQLNNYGIYRIHDEPSFEALYNLVSEVSYLGITNIKTSNGSHSIIKNIQKKADKIGLLEQIDDLIIKSLKMAYYSEKKSGHFGLGFEGYSHFTSPIRRYSDLILHRILKTKKIPKNISQLTQDISSQERKIQAITTDFADRKYARWAKDNISIKLKAKIIDISEPTALVTSKVAGMKIEILNYKGEKLFANITIKIKSANIITKQIQGFISD